MPDIELKILRLHAALRYGPDPADRDEGRPFPEAAPAPEGSEEIVLYEADSTVRFDPADGPRALPFPPSPAAAGSVRPSGPADDPDGPPAIRLEPGAYGFLQGRAETTREWRDLLEAFARQAWWEGVECSGPYILRRVREDGRWAAQVWRRLAGDGAASGPGA